MKKNLILIQLIIMFLCKLNAQQEDSIRSFVKNYVKQDDYHDRIQIFAPFRNDKGVIHPIFLDQLIKSCFAKDTFGIPEPFEGLFPINYIDNSTLTPIVVKRMMQNIKVVYDYYSMRNREKGDSLQSIAEESISYLGSLNAKYITKENRKTLLYYYNTSEDIRGARANLLLLLVGLNQFKSPEEVFFDRLEYYNDKKQEQKFNMSGFDNSNTVLYYLVGAKLGDKRKLNVLLEEVKAKKIYTSINQYHLAFLKKIEATEIIVEMFMEKYKNREMANAKEYIGLLIKSIEEIPMDFYSHSPKYTDKDAENVYNWLMKHRNNYKISNKYIYFNFYP